MDNFDQNSEPLEGFSDADYEAHVKQHSRPTTQVQTPVQVPVQHPHVHNNQQSLGQQGLGQSSTLGSLGLVAIGFALGILFSKREKAL